MVIADARADGAGNVSWIAAMGWAVAADQAWHSWAVNVAVFFAVAIVIILAYGIASKRADQAYQRAVFDHPPQPAPDDD